MIGRALLRGDVQDGTAIHVDAKNGELFVSYDHTDRPETPHQMQEQPWAAPARPSEVPGQGWPVSAVNDLSWVDFNAAATTDGGGRSR